MAIRFSLSGRALAVLLPVATLAIILLLLEILQRTGALPVTIPAPSGVWRDFINDPTVLGRHIGPTILAALLGYLTAMAIAVAAAGIATIFAVTYGPIYNFGVGLHSIPLIATTPLLVIWLGTGTPTRVVIATLASYFPMLVGAMQGFRAVDRNAAELFHVVSASRWQRFRFLVLPGSLPFLFAGFKVAAPSAVLGAIVSEWTGAERGIGVMMIYALFAFDVAKLWLAVIVACALAATAYGVLAILERLFIRWESAGQLGD